MNYSAPGEGIVSTLPQYDLRAMPTAGDWGFAQKTDDAATAAADVPLSSYVVVVANGSDVLPGELFAAAELANLVGNMTDPAWRDVTVESNGTTVDAGHTGRPLRNTSDLTTHGPRLLVGWAAVAAANRTDPSVGSRLPNDTAALGNDGFVLWRGTSTAGPWIAFTGAPTGKRGCLNAVYEFVEMMGMRFFAFDEVSYPTTPVTHAPVFDRIVEPQPQIQWRSLEDWPSFSQPLFSRRVRFVPGGRGCGDGSGLPCQGNYFGPHYGVDNGTWDQYFYGLSGRDSTILAALCGVAADGDPEGCHSQSGGAPPKFIIRDHPEWLWPHPNATERAHPEVYQARCNGATECGQVCWCDHS